MKNLFIFLTLVLSCPLHVFAKDAAIVGLDFESDLYPQTSLSLAIPFGERHDLGVRLGTQGYQAPTASGVERQRVDQYALTYGASASLIESLLAYRTGFALGQVHAPDAVGRSRYFFYEMSQGIAFRQGKVTFSPEAVVRFNGVDGEEVVSVGGKTVPTFNVFPRFGMAVRFE